MKILVIAIAKVAHEINRAYCAALGDETQVAWEDAPEWQRASAIAGVEMHLINPDATPEQSHESWLAQKLADGWEYGEVKDVQKKQHPCCVPYDQLPPEQKAKDYLFRATVHQCKALIDAQPVKVVEKDAKPAALAGILVPVKYIGPRAEWYDRLYGTGLMFSSGQTRNLPTDIARQLLRHGDLFEKADQPPFETADGEAVTADDDTARLLEQGKQAEDAKHEQQVSIQDLYDQIDQMDKSSLESFASTKYRIDLDKRKSVDSLRAQVKQLVDQFGAV